MIAKTQARVDQFHAKEHLRDLLKIRYCYSKSNPDTKEQVEQLDFSINAAREFLKANKLNIIPSKKPIKAKASLSTTAVSE